VTARATPVRKIKTDLVASEIEHALSLLDQADVPGRSTDTRLLLNAAESYRRTKNLLLRMNIESTDVAQLHGRLELLQARLLGKDLPTE
jgi:hypothetical protein